MAVTVVVVERRREPVTAAHREIEFELVDAAARRIGPADGGLLLARMMAGRAADPPQELGQRIHRYRLLGDAPDRLAPRLHDVQRFAALANAGGVDRRQRNALAVHGGLDGRRRRKLALEPIDPADRHRVAIVATGLVHQQIVEFPAAPGLAFVRMGEIEEARPPQRLGEAARRRRPWRRQKLSKGGKAAGRQDDARGGEARLEDDPATVAPKVGEAAEMEISRRRRVRSRPPATRHGVDTRELARLVGDGPGEQATAREALDVVIERRLGARGDRHQPVPRGARPGQGHDGVGERRRPGREAERPPVGDVEGDAIAIALDRRHVGIEAVVEADASPHRLSHRKNGMGFICSSASGRSSQPRSTGAV